MSEVNSSASFQAAVEVMAAANVFRRTASNSEQGNKISKEKGSRTEKDGSSSSVETGETFQGANELGANCSILGKMFKAISGLLALLASKFQFAKADDCKNQPSSDTSQSGESDEGSTEKGSSDSSPSGNNSMAGKALAAIKAALEMLSSLFSGNSSEKTDTENQPSSDASQSGEGDECSTEKGSSDSSPSGNNSMAGKALAAIKAALEMLSSLLSGNSSEDTETATGSMQDSEDTETVKDSTQDSEDTGTAKDSTQDSEDTGTAEDSTQDSEDTGTAKDSTQDSEDTGTAKDSTQDSEDTETAKDSTQDSEDTETAKDSTQDSEGTKTAKDSAQDSEDTETVTGSSPDTSEGSGKKPNVDSSASSETPNTAPETTVDESGKGAWGDPHFDLTGSNGNPVVFDHKGVNGHQYHLFSGDNIEITGTYAPFSDPQNPQIISDCSIKVGQDQIDFSMDGKTLLNGVEIGNGIHQLSDSGRLEKTDKGLTITPADGTGQVDLYANWDGLRIDPSGSFSGLDGIIGKAILENEALSNEESNAFDITR